MSYRPHGKADISATQPRARGVCDRCGFMTNHYKLKWQYDWRGPKIQNLRFLVCDSCVDAMQQNGQRTIMLPADPLPIQNARPEYYVPDNNPLSAIGGQPPYADWRLGSQIGTMVNAAGVPAAFDGNPNKPSFLCAQIITPNSSFGNYVGINWAEGRGVTTPSSLGAPVRTHTVTSYTIIGPNDTTIGSTGYVVQASPVAAGWGSWTTIDSGDIAGDVGETITGTATGPRNQFHRVAFWGGSGAISVCSVQLNVSDGSS